MELSKALVGLRAAANKSGKDASKVRFFVALCAEAGVTVTQEIALEAIKRKPGNIMDDTYVEEMIAGFKSFNLPTPAIIEKAAAISAQVDKTPQSVLARDIGSGFDVKMMTEMEADYEATMQGKEAPFHCLRNLLRLYGPDAEGNNKNKLDYLPIVDSEPVKQGKEVNIPFVSRGEWDAPAKYQVFDTATGKWIDQDVYNNMLDASTIGDALNKQIEEVDIRLKNKSGSAPQDQGARKLLVNKKTILRKQLKDAMRAYQQMLAFNSIHDIKCDFNYTNADKTELVRGQPVFFVDKQNPMNLRPVDMATFLSYRPEKVDPQSKEAFKDLLKSKPTKTRGATPGKSASKDDKAGLQVSMPGSIEQFEAYLAMTAQWLDVRENIVTLFKKAESNRPLRDTLIEMHAATKSFYNKHITQYEKDKIDSPEQKRDVA